MFNADYSLFTNASNGVSFYPNQKSHVNSDHLNFFRFIGRMIGKAVFDGELLELEFSKPLFKMMVGDDLELDDLKDLDNDFYNNIKWVLTNSVEGQAMSFSVDQDYFGTAVSTELIKNGANVDVNEENKVDYVERYCIYQMYTSVKDQIDAFLKGFHELIPKKVVGVFTAQELGLLI